MADFSFTDLYIGYKGHPRFTINKIIEDDVVRVIIQKYEVLLFTNKGELLGDPEFGCDLILLLYQTKISADTVKRTILEQINTYIPELLQTHFTLSVEFLSLPDVYENAMQVNLQISEYEINATIT